MTHPVRGDVGEMKIWHGEYSSSNGAGQLPDRVTATHGRMIAAAGNHRQDHLPKLGMSHAFLIAPRAMSIATNSRSTPARGKVSSSAEPSAESTTIHQPCETGRSEQYATGAGWRTSRTMVIHNALIAFCKPCSDVLRWRKRRTNF